MESRLRVAASTPAAGPQTEIPGEVSGCLKVGLLVERHARGVPEVDRGRDLQVPR
jgi:hypothetical protein